MAVTQPPDWTTLLMHPVVGPAVCMGLHSLDYCLTMYAAHLYYGGANRVYAVDGSIELNPIFQSVIDSRRWFSKRFLLTLVLVGFIFFALAWLTRSKWDMLSANADANAEEALAGLRYMFSVLMGSFIFTRLAVIGSHVRTIWLFRRMTRPDSPIRGSIAFDRPTGYGVAAFHFGGVAVLLGVAACVAPSGWLVGGSLGCALIFGYVVLLGFITSRRREKKRPKKEKA